MRTSSRLALTVLAGLFAASAIAADKPLATVNGVAIPQAKMDLLIKQITERGRKDSPELRQALKDDLVTREIVSQEAVRIGLDKSADVQQEMEMAKQGVLLRAYIVSQQKQSPITDADLKKEYDKMKASMGGDKEYHARHILVKTEDEAKKALDALAKGKKFEELAKEKSEDPGSKQNGGDLGWAAPGNFVKEFSEAMTKLAKGQLTKQAVKTQFGYHIIKLDDIREQKGPSFEEVKPGLQQQAQAQQLEKMIAGLKAKAKVE